MAISNPLMEDTSIDGATGVLLNITGGKDVALREINEAATTIHESVHDDATIIFGMVEDSNIKDELYVMVIATGTDKDLLQQTTRKVVEYKDGIKRDHISPRGPLRLNSQRNEDSKKGKLMGSGVNITDFGVVPGDDRYKDEDFDVPTFLRRQVD